MNSLTTIEPNFRRYLAPDFAHYFCGRTNVLPRMESQTRPKQREEQ